ncbi:hypothetical protein [Cytophaga aurantiaca]|uniref:hypothetical protein n=1 Tax=Cytophaga aurantiaca TaxID=29530 RepID=UPI000362BEBC|nr:hypothetical protein [Cytophaga aurantiaca]
MRFYSKFILLLLIGCYSCDTLDKKESVEAVTKVDTADSKPAIQYLKTDYPDRVFAFKKMPDASMEEQVIKYEQFSALFIEYVGIYKTQPLYSIVDQENNTEAYNVLRDEMVSLKEKLRKNMSSFSKDQEVRLDSADARMNKYLPQVYK